MIPAHVSPRRFDCPPFSSICSDILFVTRREPILSAMCVDTGVVFFDAMPDGTMDSVLKSLHRLSSRYVVQFRRLLWDNAKVFGSSKTLRELKNSGHPDLVIEHTPPHGSTSNPVERAHRECWAILRSREFVRHLRKDDWRSCLEDVSATINRRPIAVYHENNRYEILTPAKLAFGSCFGVDGARVVHVRQYFYEQVFLIRRRRHTPQARRALLSVGALVLVKNVESTKLDLPFDVARIVSINKGSLTISTKGVVKKVPTTIVAPLDQFLNADIPAERRVATSGDRVVDISTSS